MTLARPWFVTGEDERLAVVVAPSTAPDPAVQPFVSWLARDPVVRTGSPAQWPQADVLLGHAAEGAATIALPEANGAQVVVVPYEVFFADGQWHADVDLSTAPRSSFAPFVRLALARYQPTSSGVSLSTIVGSDIVNVLPDRELSIERTGRSITVTLSGDAAEGLVEARVEQAVDGRQSDLTRLDPAAGGPGSWTRVPGLVATGLVNVPLGPLDLPSGVPVRIVVREIAASAIDANDVSDVPELIQRSLFIEHIELPPLD